MIKLAYERYHTFMFRGSMISVPEAHDYVAVDNDGTICSFAHQPMIHEGCYYDGFEADEELLEWTPFCIGRDKEIAGMIFFKQKHDGIIELIPLDRLGEYARCFINGTSYAFKKHHSWIAVEGDGEVASYYNKPVYDEDMDCWWSSSECETIATKSNLEPGLYRIIQLPNGIYEGELQCPR